MYLTECGGLLMATYDFRLAAKTLLSAMIATGTLLSCPPIAAADDPEQPAQQGQDACAGDDQAQPQDPQGCGAGIANRAIGEAKNAADQAARAGQNNQAGPPGDRPSNDVLSDSKCIIWNGVPTIGWSGMTRTASPSDSPMEGKPCWAVYGMMPTH